MLSKSIDEITNDVRVAMDEIALNASGFEGESDNTDMDTIIASKIEDALRFVYSNADWSLLDPSAISKASDSAYSVTSGVGRYVLPDNYLRLVYAKFSSWNRYLGQEDIILWNDPAYAMLADTYTTGTAERPKIALGWDSGGKCLELYSASVKKTDDAFEIGYMTEPEISDSKYDIPEKVYRAVIYYIAGLTLTTYREAQPAQLMFNEANDLMGFTASAQQVQAQQ